MSEGPDSTGETVTGCIERVAIGAIYHKDPSDRLFAVMFKDEETVKVIPASGEFIICQAAPSEPRTSAPS